MLEGLKRFGSNHRRVVDDKAGCGGDAERLGSLRLLADRARVFISIQAGVELGLVQLQLGRKAFQLIFCESALVFAGLPLEEQVVISPELTLFVSTFGCFRSPDGFIA